MPNEPDHQVLSRPYGTVTVLEEGNHYRIKRVVIDAQPSGAHPTRQMTCHFHHHRSEHWIVVSGTVLVVCDGVEQLLVTGQSTYVPPCTPHRLINPGVLPAQLVEIQNGEYLGEDDMQVLDFDPYTPS